MGSYTFEKEELNDSNAHSLSQNQIISDFDSKLFCDQDKNIPESMSLKEYQALIEKIYFK